MTAHLVIGLTLKQLMIPKVKNFLIPVTVDHSSHQAAIAQPGDLCLYKPLTPSLSRNTLLVLSESYIYQIAILKTLNKLFAYLQPSVLCFFDWHLLGFCDFDTG